MRANPLSHGPRIWGTLDPFREGGDILGRRVANAAFLTALLAADPFDGYHFFLPDESACASLRAWVEERFPCLMRREAVLIRPSFLLPESLSATRYHCMHLSDALTRYSTLAQLRNVFSSSLFPVTAITHSLSYARFMPEYLGHLWAGVSRKDAIIASSESARLVLERVFDGLRRAYGLDERAFPAPRLVRIPLGVDMDSLPKPEDRWNASSRQSAGQAMRQRLGLGDETVFLSLSRFSPYSKMDLLPLFAAFTRAFALGLPQDGHALVLSGWADTEDPLPEALMGYARNRGIRVRLVSRPDQEERGALYAAADVFVSPSDNIQESFGLTLAEAGGAGLPVIASDFDGYRDIVLHGETGLLVPTLGFARSEETDLQSLLWFDNQYHLKLAQETAVDVPELAEALVLLGTNRELREKMGKMGRARVAARFAWKAVIASCVALWNELAATPLSVEEEAAARGAVHPLRMRFAEYFQGHFLQTLEGQALRGLTLRRAPAGETLYRGKLPLTHYAGMEHILDPEAVRRLLVAARRAKPAEDLLRELEDFFAGKAPRCLARERAALTVLWSLKHDYLERAGGDSVCCVNSPGGAPGAGDAS
jgi:glycosyltransferase involved in cell wall biosynthesis